MKMVITSKKLSCTQFQSQKYLLSCTKSQRIPLPSLSADSELIHLRFQWSVSMILLILSFFESKFSDQILLTRPYHLDDYFEAYYVVDLKSKHFSLNCKTVEIPSDLNHIGHGVYLSKF